MRGPFPRHYSNGTRRAASVSPANRSAAKAEGTIASAPSPAASKMAERALPKCQRLAVRIEKARPPLPCRDRADLGDRNAGCRSLLAQWLDLAGRHACHDFIVVTAGKARFDQPGLPGARDARAAGERSARGCDFGANAG